MHTLTGPGASYLSSLEDAMSFPEQEDVTQSPVGWLPSLLLAVSGEGPGQDPACLA